MPLLALLAAMVSLPPLPFLSPMFSDQMVLQRDKPNVLWGWTSPGAHVRVTVADKSAVGVADANGRWTARLTPPPVGGPYKVVVEGPTKVVLEDVLVGDVWICSGQSNMEMGLTMAANGPGEAAKANDPNLRLYMAPRQIGYTPQQVNPGAHWQRCTPESVSHGGWGGFSAVGYYFGKALVRELSVPIGLIQAAWGGTSAEAWTREEALRPIDDFNAVLDKIDGLKGGPVYGTYLDLWGADNDPGIKGNWQSPETLLGGWSVTDVPTEAPLKGLGTVWLRKEVDLGNPPVTGNSVLWLGPVSDIDTAWVNGRQVGTGSGEWERQYWFDSSLLHPGINTIVVRFLHTAGRPGFLGKPGSIYLGLPEGEKVPLEGQWHSKIGAVLPGATPPYDYEPNPTVPTTLANGMIAPIAPLALRGVIWYQGETNGGRGYQYRKLLPALIADWRKLFGEGDFPFLVVSLANWMPRRDQPGDDGWAELREAQAMTVQHVKNTGLAVTIDVGDAVDIHPKDKHTVGERLALNALAIAYRKHVSFSGPVYKGMRREGAAIRLTFSYADGGMVAKGGRLAEFSVAGADHRWHWAEAKIDGDKVVVRSDEVTEPLAVRYAWQANPKATLYNGAGLPAVPFRTDKWQEVSKGTR